MLKSKSKLAGELELRPRDEELRLRNIALLFMMIESDPLPDGFWFRDENAPEEFARNPFEGDELSGSVK
jgi:hypothetical protein